jgi:general L-amino acid transport system permease protein
MSEKSPELKVQENKPEEKLIIFKPKPFQAPPDGSIGIVRWLRENLFYSWISTLFTFGSLYLMYTVLYNFIDWSIVNAVWEADSRRECLDKNPDGACWAGVIFWHNSYIYGRYPKPEQWRVNFVFITLVFWMLPIWLPKVKEKIAVGISVVLVFPFGAAYVLSGGERGWFWQIMVALMIAVFIINWANALCSIFTGDSFKLILARRTGFYEKHEAQHKYPQMMVTGLLVIVFFFVLGDWALPPVLSHHWGGLFLSLLIGGIGVVTCLPMGIVLALARRSKLPIIKTFAVTYIELFRSVPLITMLFMSVTILPFFLPAGLTLDKLAQVLVGQSLFLAAFMAETIRGGLQAMSRDQYEAADALGLNYWLKMRLIIMPQALKIMIPSITGSFIGTLKDTTLVSIIGIFDILLMTQLTARNPKWLGFSMEPLTITTLFFFILCFSLSKYSQYLEKKLNRS